MALLKEYVLEFGKYGSSIGMAAYALLSLWIFWQTDVLGQSRQWTYILLDALQALVLFCSFVPLALLRGDISLLLYFAMSYVLLLAIAHGPGLAYSYMPPLFLRNISLLLGIGLQLLASLDGFSLGGERGLLSYKSFRQWAFLLLAFVLAMGVPQLLCRLSFLRHLSHAYGLWIWISLAGVWLLGHATNGSKIRLGLGLFYFQPSEFAKLALVFLLASLLWKGRGAGWRGLLWTAVYGAGAVGLLALSRDLGTALVFYALVCGVVVMATGRWIYGVLGLLLGASASAAAYKIFSHVQIRVSAWLNPWTDVDRGGYQIAQSMFALGNGGLFGQGAGRGAAKAIPYVEADFIFSALAEEWGLLSCLALLLLFFLLYAQTHMLGRRTGDRFYSLLSMAVGLSLAFQAFLTIGGGIKFIPLTGITLPFVSYGGSSLMSSMMMAFVVAGVYQKTGRGLPWMPSPRPSASPGLYIHRHFFRPVRFHGYISDTFCPYQPSGHV